MLLLSQRKRLYKVFFQFCQRKVKLTIPDEYINEGNTVTKWYDAGVMNMEMVFQDEERDCNN